MSADGIPLIVNGRALSGQQIEALREARLRREAAQGKKTSGAEINGPKGAEPTRYGDWERKGRAVDF
jgi:hypothetical protein